MTERKTSKRCDCLDCGWSGESLDEGRAHAEKTGCRSLRTHTVIRSPTGRLIDERVEIHQV